MRTFAAMVLGICMTLAAIPGRANPAWYADGDDVLQARANRATRVASIPGVHSLAATRNGGVWAMSRQRLVHLAHSGEIVADVALATGGHGLAVRLAVDAYDDSVLVSTDASLLLHFSSGGDLIRRTTLAGVPDALVVAADQTLWLLIDGSLVHLAKDMRILDVPRRAASGQTFTAFAIDSVRQHAWLLDAQGARRIPLDTAGDSTGDLPQVPARAIASDMRTGESWLLDNDQLIAIDARGSIRVQARLPLPRADGPAALHFDYEQDTILVQIAGTLMRIDRDARILETADLPADWLVAAPAPLRVEPSVQLIRPPAGGATYDTKTQLTMRIQALCNGQSCDPGEAYLAGAALDVDIDGLPATSVIDPVEGTFLVIPGRPMHAGANRINVRVTDRLGHRAVLSSVITVLQPEDGTATSTDDTMHAPVARPGSQPRAANKPPSITLTAPVAGATFTAGSTIALAANASDSDGTISRVEFYRGGSTLVGTAASAPYQVLWQNASAGSYAITAKAFDNRNGNATSLPVQISVVNNQPPTISLTSPTQGAFYVPGASIPLAATASDTDGQVTRVEFLDGVAVIGTLANAPYAMDWASAAPGPHLIVARATDDKGTVATSQSIDILIGQGPTVVVRSPVACSSVEGPADLVLAADVVSTTGTIARVEYFDGGAPVGTALAYPWYVVLERASLGDHSITARAIDDRGMATTSRPAVVTVRPPNQPPTVAITSPIDGARFALGSSVSFTATAADGDGSVTAVEYRIGGSSGTLIGRATAPPYPVTWSNVPAGTHTIFAIATDDRNSSSTSSPVHATVAPNTPPSVQVSTPVPGARFTAPANVTVTATAADADGSIAKVDFLANGATIGTATAAPFAIVWSAATAGSYAISARATDNLGAAATSTSVPITITSNAAPTITLISPAAGAQYFAPATISLTADALDSDGSVAKVDFYSNGTPIGSSVTAPFSYAWNDVGGGTYAITAIATDNQGAAATSAARTITVIGGAVIDPASGLDGSTVADDTVLVSGTINAPANSGVLINGMLAQLAPDGRFFANEVPLSLGDNSIEIAVVAQDGQVTTRSITVSSSDSAPFGITAAPTDGIAPLQVTFEIADRRGAAFQRAEFDYDGNGSVDYTAVPSQFVDGVFRLFVTYPAGTFRAVVTLFDANGAVIQTTARMITARTVEQQDSLLQGVYEGMLAQLRTGRIASALNAITPDLHEKYTAVFSAYGPNLPAVIDGLGTLEPNWFTDDRAEYLVIRNTQEGKQAFLVDFVRGPDGVWRIYGM